MSAELESRIEAAWDDRANVTPQSSDVREAVVAALGLLESGKGRVAEPDGKGGWTVNQWLKKAVLLSFRLKSVVFFVSCTLPISFWVVVSSLASGS